MSRQSSDGAGGLAGRVPSPVLAVLVALLLAATGLGGGSLIGLAVSEALSALDIELSVIPGTILSTLLLQGVAFGGLSLLYLSYRDVAPLEYLGVRMPDLEGWIYAAAGYVLAFVTAFSLIFVGVHWTSLAGPVSGRALTVTMLFVPGLVFGVTYEATDNLVVPSLIHGAYNATLFTLAYLSLAFG